MFLNFRIVFMKKFTALFFIFSLFFSGLTIAQDRQKVDAYQVETEGYFINPVSTTRGIVLSNNLASKLYLIKNNKLLELIASPGCGRYFAVSPDRSIIGFKLIKPDGMQVPAIYDLNAMKVSELSAPVDLCGQVSFSNNGKIAYTIGHNLHVFSNGIVSTFPLGTYANIAPISPDGNYVIFNNDHDQLFMADLTTGQTTQMTDNTQGYMYPRWSPDGNKICFSTLTGTLMIGGKSTNTIYTIGQGENASWSDDSQYIIYNVVSRDHFEYKGSEIYKARYDGTSVIQLTNTPEINEMFPVFGPGNEIIYSTYDKREIVSTAFNFANSKTKNRKILISAPTPLPLDTLGPDDFLQKKSKANTMVAGDVPYCHQVYDTPSWHSGWWSCAPTTAIMSIAYFNRLPKWPTTVNHGMSWDPHTSNYGSYVADRYRFREVYYETTSDDYAGNTSYGGYGYMWGLGSPSSYMDDYFINHGITSVRSTSTTFANVQAEINNNYPFSICSLITSAGHLTLAVGYVAGQQTIIFNDPYGNKNNGYVNYYGKNAYYDWPGYNNGYANINSMEWSVTSETSQPVYNDTIIDDVYYDHGFFIYNQGIAKMRYYHDKITGGYNGHFWYTLTSPNTTIDTCYVTWTPTLPVNGNYEVKVYIPSNTASATGARYKVYYSGGSTSVVVNQATHQGQWVSLGTFPFTTSEQAYVRLGDGTGITGQEIAFDAVKWHYADPVDNVAPTTATSVAGVWQTHNFTANFTDTDNTGGSGIEKSFYQVLYFNGTEWHANAQRGFFGDNFDSYDASVWTVPASSGTWEVHGGKLVQTDSSVNNTNIYAALKQTLSNRYLYDFYVKMDAATYGTNEHRFGFHFHSDNGSLINRGNSYFIFFRQETSTLEFFKVVNDAFTQVLCVNNVLTNFGQWYNIKVIFDRITGKIVVYRDNILLGTWTDTSPLTTAGNYISFRTGHCKVYFDELKVYRSRYPSVTVTVGTSSINDIRYQNPDPSTYGAKIKSIVNDAAGNLSAIDYYNLNIDWTVPVCSSVNDGMGNDDSTTTSLTTLAANWTASGDSNSGIARYWYAIGTSPGDTNVVGWTDNALNTSVTISGLTLTNGEAYYFTVKTENGAGLINTCHSNGVTVIALTEVTENDDIPVVSLYPNPFKGSATLFFELNSYQQISITLTDILGKEILISNSMYPPGKHSIPISKKIAIAKGVYVIKFETPSNVKRIKIIKY